MTAASLKGRTILPLPNLALQSVSRPESSAQPSQKKQEDVQILEAVMLTWTRQMKIALRAPSFEALEVTKATRIADTI